MKKITLLFSCVGVASFFLTGCQSSEKPSSTAEKPAAAAAATAAPAVETAAAPSQPAAAASASSVIRIKAGASSPVTDSSGNVWQPDQGFDGGDTVERDASTQIAKTKDPELFLTEHYGMNSFSYKLPNGKYTAKLYFAETFDGVTEAGGRVFSFDVQGHPYKDFDVYAKAGGSDIAYVVTQPVEVTNGVFRIDFTPNVENPEINAIEIIPQP